VIKIVKETINCISWYYSQDGNTCIKTEAWYYSPEWESKKIECPAWTYSQTWAWSCNICEEWSYSEAWATNCIICPAWSSCTSISVTECEAWTYSEAWAISCIICPAWKYCETWETTPKSCAANTYSEPKSWSCNNCPTNSTTNNLTEQTSINACLWIIGYYDCQTGICKAVEIWYYSPVNSNERIACTNKPDYSYYIWNGWWTDNCPWSCNSDDWYSQSGNSCILITYSRNDPSWWSCNNVTCTSRWSRGPCSVTCWWWTRTRICSSRGWIRTGEVQCIRNTDNAVVSDSYCNTTTKPATSQSCSGTEPANQSQECNKQACNASCAASWNIPALNHWEIYEELEAGWGEFRCYIWRKCENGTLVNIYYNC
jgi:hypothetical protein